MMKNEDHIKVNKKKSDNFIVNIEQKNTTERSAIFCDEIEYMHDKVKDLFDHHIMIYNKGDLIFKVWLPNEPEDKQFANLKEALKSVGMEIYRYE